MQMKITIPERSLVLLIGPSGSGKSTFAKKHFKSTEILSSDHFRGVVCDDEHNQAATKDAFEILHLIAAKRLARGCPTVVDATNVLQEARSPLIDLAKKNDFNPVAIVFDLSEAACLAGNNARRGRQVDPRVIRNQIHQMNRSLLNLPDEGFACIFTLTSLEEVDRAIIEKA